MRNVNFQIGSQAVCQRKELKNYNKILPKSAKKEEEIFESYRMHFVSCLFYMYQKLTFWYI